MSGAAHMNALPEGYKLMWYEITGVLGRGGFGITYLANDTNLNQQVAVKEFFPNELATRTSDSEVHATSTEYADAYDWGLHRFIDEARTLAQFRHPNIVPVYTVFEANQTAYMVMEYLQGRTCSKYFRANQVGEAELTRILGSLLDALKVIHATGFIHRDIKPDNILLRDDNTPVLLDFGSARQALGDRTSALTSLVTPGYAPFEQYGETNSDQQKQGPWSDIYSLGATLYMALTSRGPVDALSRATSMLEQSEDPLRPAMEVGEGRFSPQFLLAVDRALSFRAQDRPQSVEEWQAMFPAWGGGMDVDITSGAGDAEAPTQYNPNAAAGAPTQVATARTARTQAAPPQGPATQPTWAQSSGVFPDGVESVSVPSPGRGKLPLIGGAAAVVVVLAAVAVFLLRGGEETAPPTAKPTPPVATAPVEKLDEAQVADLLTRAESDLRAGRLTFPPGSNAYERYHRVLAARPDNAAAAGGINQIVAQLVAQGDRATAENDFESAEGFLAEAERVSPDSTLVRATRVRLESRKQAGAMLKAARELQESGQTASAIDKLRGVLVIEPANTEAKALIDGIVGGLIASAREALAAGRFGEAESTLNAAANIDKQNRDVLAAIDELVTQKRANAAGMKQRIDGLLADAKADLEAGRLEAPAGKNALERYRAVLELDADNAAAKQGIADVASRYLARTAEQTQAGKFEEAQAALDGAARLGTDAAAVAAAQRALDDAQGEAVAQARRAKTVGDGLAKAQAALKDGRLAEAEESFRRVLTAEAGNADASKGLEQIGTQYRSLADAATKDKDFTRARLMLERAAGIEPGAPALKDSQGRLDAAEARYKQELAAREAGERLQAQIADLLGKADGALSGAQLDVAEQRFRDVLKLDATNARAAQGLATVVARYLEGADAALAKQDFERAAALIASAQKVQPAEPAIQKARQRLEGARTEARIAALLSDAGKRLAAGEPEPALKLYDEVLSLDQASAPAAQGRAAVAKYYADGAEKAIAAGRFDEAETLLAAAAKVDARAVGIASGRERLAAARTQAELRQSVEELLASAKQDLQAGRIDGTDGRNALARYGQILQIDPGNAAAEAGITEIAERFVADAGSALSKERLAEAKALLDKASALRPELPSMTTALQAYQQANASADRRDKIDTQLGLAERALAQDNFDGALVAYRQVLDIDAQSAAARTGIDAVLKQVLASAEAAIGQGDLDGAQALLERAAKIGTGEQAVAAVRTRLDQALAERAQASRLEGLLAAAAEDIRARRLTSPANNNAYDKLQEVLKLDPGNAKAGAALEEVASAYLGLAEQSLARNDYDRAATYVAKAREVAPGFAAALEAEQRLATARSQAGERAEAERQRLAEQQARDRAEAERRAQQQASDRGQQQAAAERRAREQAEADRRGQQQAATEREARERAEADRARQAAADRAREQAEAERRAAAERQAQAPRGVQLASLLGSWCGQVGIDLSESTMTFRLPGGAKQSYDVRKYELKQDAIWVYWDDGSGGSMVVEFGDFSSNAVTQKRGKSVSASSWQSYNRPLKRCTG